MILYYTILMILYCSCFSFICKFYKFQIEIFFKLMIFENKLIFFYREY